MWWFVNRWRSKFRQNSIMRRPLNWANRDSINFKKRDDVKINEMDRPPQSVISSTSSSTSPSSISASAFCMKHAGATDGNKFVGFLLAQSNLAKPYDPTDIRPMNSSLIAILSAACWLITRPQIFFSVDILAMSLVRHPITLVDISFSVI